MCLTYTRPHGLQATRCPRGSEPGPAKSSHVWSTGTTLHLDSQRSCSLD